MTGGADSPGTNPRRREAELQRREAYVAAREAARVKRMEEADQILTAADERDVAADARDTAADKRERDRDLARLLAPQGEGAYGDDWPERRGAARDRKDSDAEDADQS